MRYRYESKGLTVNPTTRSAPMLLPLAGQSKFWISYLCRIVFRSNIMGPEAESTIGISEAPSSPSIIFCGGLDGIHLPQEAADLSVKPRVLERGAYHSGQRHVSQGVGSC
jgi:hypothetical protein